MLMNKLKTAFVIVLMLGFVTTGATVFTCRTAAQDNKPPMAAEKKANEPPIAAEKRDAPLKSDMSLFRSTWRLISITTPNKVHFPHECKWTFKDDKIQMTEGFGIGEPVVGPQENAYHVGMDKDDPPSAPNGFNLTVGDKKKFTFRGIFAWDGSRLKLYFPLGRQVVRPTEIPASGAGGNDVVLVLEHVDNKGDNDERTHQPKANADDKAAAQSEGPQKNGTKHDAPKTDLDRLQGVWSVVSAERGGKTDKVEKEVFMVDGKRACWQTSDFEMQGGLYLDSTSKPKSYDFVTSTRTIEGIYLLEGDTLRIRYDLGTESKRPTGFTTEKGSLSSDNYFSASATIRIPDPRRTHALFSDN